MQKYGGLYEYAEYVYDPLESRTLCRK